MKTNLYEVRVFRVGQTGDEILWSKLFNVLSHSSSDRIGLELMMSEWADKQEIPIPYAYRYEVAKITRLSKSKIIVPPQRMEVTA